MLLCTQMYPFSQETAQSVSWLFFVGSQVFAGSTGGRLVKGTAPNCQPTKNFRLTIEGICGILFQKYNEEEFIMEHTTRAPSMRGLSVRDMVLCSLFAALMAVCAWLTIPGEVPFTLQTFGLFATLVLLGGKRGTIAIALYLILGAVGLPVFSGFRGGFGILFGTTGGYIFGFVLSGLLYWAMTALLGNRPWVQLLALVLGACLYYAAGTGWFLLVYLQKTGPISLGVVLAKCVIPFLLPDAAKLVLAWLLTHRLARFVP